MNFILLEYIFGNVFCIIHVINNTCELLSKNKWYKNIYREWYSRKMLVNNPIIQILFKIWAQYFKMIFKKTVVLCAFSVFCNNLYIHLYGSHNKRKSTPSSKWQYLKHRMTEWSTNHMSRVINLPQFPVHWPINSNLQFGVTVKKCILAVLYIECLLFN